MGRPAIVVKGCDQRALVVLEKESQLDRSQIYVIGMACDGMGRPKCETCDVHEPRGADVVVGQAAAKATDDLRPIKRYAAINAFLARSSAERLAYWRQELARCVKCYACRQVCPMCYCPRCIVDKNRPQAISTSATLKGNFAWHITRAFHLAGAVRGLRGMHAGLPGGHRPAAAESLAGPGGGRELRLPRRRRSPGGAGGRFLRAPRQGELHPMSEVLSLATLRTLVDKWIADGRRVAGPRLVNDRLLYDWLDSAGAIDARWQQCGRGIRSRSSSFPATKSSTAISSGGSASS